ncbi:hypothetical protein NDU88_010571 [Pleurodeles waltl]|uniref:Uncharacterized protein n=1 Tax=Pleurodeles waltl TaxID=8319 RepID=A0AAV7QW95_PLEWA|nr:hypothetical protein NDU88_010571 [Pleurodeles waltl]
MTVVVAWGAAAPSGTSRSGGEIGQSVGRLEGPPKWRKEKSDSGRGEPLEGHCEAGGPVTAVSACGQQRFGGLSCGSGVGAGRPVSPVAAHAACRSAVPCPPQVVKGSCGELRGGPCCLGALPLLQRTEHWPEVES